MRLNNSAIHRSKLETVFPNETCSFFGLEALMKKHMRHPDLIASLALAKYGRRIYVNKRLVI